MFRKYIYKILTKNAQSSEHADYLYKLKKKEISIRIIQIAILFSFFAVWQILANFEFINTFLFSSPSKIASLFLEMCQKGEMFHHIRITLTENIIGFTGGTIIGIIVSIILWWSNFLYEIVEPYIVILNSVPKIALGPVIIVWMGNNSSAIIVMALAISVIVTIMMLINGFHEVEENKIKLLKTLGANKQQILRKVILPASIPTIFAALKVSVGLSLVGTIVGEFLVSKAGLGYLIVYGGQVFNLNLVMTSLIILSIIAALMYYLVLLLEKYFIKWD
ncbi:MAG: ABC transporter permease [bacterium]